MTAASASNCPWFRPGRKAWLKWTLVIVLVASVCQLGRMYWKSRQQQNGIAQVRALRGEVYYDYQCQLDDTGERLLSEKDPPGPAWLYRWFGRDFFHGIFYVSFSEFERGEAGLLAMEVRELTDAELPQLAKLQSVRWLSLAGTRITDAGLEQLSALPNLERLWLGHTAVTDTGLASMQEMSRLKRLSLAGIRVTDVGLRYLKGFTGLEGLDLAGTLITDDGLAHLRQMANLKDLSIAGTRIGDSGLEHIAALTRLERLNLSATRMTDAGMRHMSGLVHLKHLTLDGIGVSDVGLADLENLVKLRFLSLCATEVSDTGLVHLERLTGLRTLRVNDTDCTFSGAVELYTVLQHRRLDEALESVLDVERNAENLIVSLDSSNIRVTDSGLAHLTGLNELEWLHLGGTEVSDAGLAHLSALSKLALLDLTGTRVTDAGLEHLRGLPNLQRLHLGRTKVTDAGERALTQASAGRIRVHRAGFLHLAWQEPTREDVGSHVSVASVLMSQGRVAEAKAHLLRALERDPSRKDAHHGLALILREEQKVDEAVEHWREALRTDPAYFKAHLSLGLVLIEAGDAAESARHLAEAVRLRPKDPFANYSHGQALERQGKIEQAAAHYRRAMDTDAEYVPALVGLARLLVRADHPKLYDVESATELAEKAAELTLHDDPLALEALGEAHAATGRFREAAAVVERALQIARAMGDGSLTQRLAERLASYQNAGAEAAK